MTRGREVRRVAVVAVALAFATGVGSALATARGAPAERQQWLSYGGDDQLTNSAASQRISRATLAGMRLRWRRPLDGRVYASPVVARVRIGARTEQVVVVATQADTLYAFDAANGKPLWRRGLGRFDLCGHWGVTSTPAVDPSRGLVYVIGSTGRLHALRLATGAEAPGFPLSITGSRTPYEYVWGGLRIVGGRLLVPVGSPCDNSDEHGNSGNGRIDVVALDRPRVVATWDPVPGSGTLGGIWGYGGVSVEPGGRFLYVGVGNALVHDESCKCWHDDAGYAEKLVRLDAATLRPTAANKPADVPTNHQDVDFGAAPVLFQPSGCPPLAAMNSKSTFLYVWDRTRIGAGPVGQVELSDGIVPFVGQPAYSARLRMLYDAQVVTKDGGAKNGYGVAAIGIGSDCKPHELWRVHTGDGNQPPPLVIGDVVFVPAGAGGVVALDGRTGRILWHYGGGSNVASAPLVEVDGTLFAALGATLAALAPR